MCSFRQQATCLTPPKIHVIIVAQRQSWVCWTWGYGKTFYLVKDSELELALADSGVQIDEENLKFRV